MSDIINEAFEEFKKNQNGYIYGNFPIFDHFEEMELPKNFDSIKDSFFAVLFEKYPKLVQKENKSKFSDNEFYINNAIHMAFEELMKVVHGDGATHRFTIRLCDDENNKWVYCISDVVIEEFKENMLLIPLIMHDKMRIFRMVEQNEN